MKGSLDGRSTPPPYVAPPEREFESEGGVVHISNTAIAVIARNAALHVPGVVEFVGGFVDNLAGIVGKKPADYGVRVELVDDQVVIELNVIVDFGVFIPKVAWEIQQAVRKAVVEMTGKSVKSVNVIVQGVKVPEERPRKPAEMGDLV